MMRRWPTIRPSWFNKLTMSLSKGESHTRRRALLASEELNAYLTSVLLCAIDTNIVVRYLTADHPEQSPKTKAVIDSQNVFVCTTVLLETEWVLRSVYDFARADIVKALTAFAGLPRVTLEDAALAATALSWTLKGMDFADALHLAKAQGCDGFASFDLRLAKAAKDVSGIEVHTP